MQKKIQLMQKNSKNSEKFRIDGSFIFIASAFYPAKSHKKLQKNSIDANSILKLRKMQKNSIIATKKIK
jgi:hypothetical protein